MSRPRVRDVCRRDVYRSVKPPTVHSAGEDEHATRDYRFDRNGRCLRLLRFCGRAKDPQRFGRPAEHHVGADSSGGRVRGRRHAVSGPTNWSRPPVVARLDRPERRRHRRSDRRPCRTHGSHHGSPRQPVRGLPSLANCGATRDGPPVRRRGVHEDRAGVCSAESARSSRSRRFQQRRLLRCGCCQSRCGRSSLVCRRRHGWPSHRRDRATERARLGNDLGGNQPARRPGRPRGLR